MRARLAGELVRRGYRVDIVLLSGALPVPSPFPPDVRVVALHARRAAFALAPLARYLTRSRPTAIVSAEDHANLVTLLALRCTRISSKTVVTMHVRTLVYAAPPWSKHYWIRRAASVVYRRATCVGAVSHGLAEEVTATFGLPATTVRILPNPVVTGQMRPAPQCVPHRWLASASIPVLCGCGTLSPRKGFDVMLRAFATVRRSVTCRLIIVGEGRERENLVRLAAELGVTRDVDLVGAKDDPSAHDACLGIRNVLALEGFGNVIVEAMACGTTVVAADCPHGPREILDGGTFGYLTPVGDPDAVADAIHQALLHPLEPDLLRDRANAFSASASAEAYLRVL